VFVSGLHALAGLPVLSQWSRSFHCVPASVCQTCAFGRCLVLSVSFLITCPVFAVCFSKILSVFSGSCIFGLVHVFNKSLVSIVKWYVTLSVCFTALKINIENKILCFCVQKSKMYLVVNIILFSYKNWYIFSKL